MINTIEEMKEYLVKELNYYLEKLMNGNADTFAIFYSGKANAIKSSLANLGYGVKVDIKLEKWIE